MYPIGTYFVLAGAAHRARHTRPRRGLAQRDHRVGETPGAAENPWLADMPTPSVACVTEQLDYHRFSVAVDRFGGQDNWTRSERVSNGNGRNRPAFGHCLDKST
jgi:hypothetical protein